MAHVLYGSIVGNVTDPSNAAVAGAIATATNTETNQSRQTTTDDAGLYNLPTIPSGTYRVRAKRSPTQTLENPPVPAAGFGLLRKPGLTNLLHQHAAPLPPRR